jgi:MYXO-CTERM domain-containing protein
LLFFPATASADQTTLLDSTVTIAETDNGIVYENLPGGFPTDLTAPVDFAGGTVHVRATVDATPGGTMTGVQFCLVQTDRMPANRACTPAADIMFDATGTFETSVAVGSLEQAANLDFSMALAEFAIVATDSAGEVIDPNNAAFMGSPDTTPYLPLTVRVEAELVSAGDTFAGYPSDAPMVSETPAFNPGSGSYENQVSVEISTAATADIYYTTDGSDPDSGSTAYSGPINVTSDTTIRAIAIEAGKDPSPIAEATYTITAGASAGLRGRYFEGREFDNLVATRTDPSIEFSWPEGVTPDGVSSKPFSVVWTGTVEPLYSEEFTFTTVSDDGVRLWVDNQLIIDDWEFQGATTNTGNIRLQAGEQYDIWLEYFDGAGAGEVSLSWVSDTQPAEIIPDSQMLPTDGPTGDAPVSLLADEDENELNEAVTEPFTFQVKRRGNLNSALELTLMVTGDATLGEDFDMPTTVTIPAGQLSAEVEITVIDDEDVEGAESATITIIDGDGYTLAEPISTSITILDNDIDVFAISGEVLYVGTETGSIVVEAFTEETPVFAVRQTVLLNPGTFTIAGVEPGDYTVIAYIDSNGNELLDSGETWSIYQDENGDELQITIPNEDNVSVVIDLNRRPGEVEGAEDDEGGCGCATSDPASTGSTIALILLGLVGLRVRRRRQAA